MSQCFKICSLCAIEIIVFSRFKLLKTLLIFSSEITSDELDISSKINIEGFEDNATLINPNDNMGIGSSTYLIDKDWYNENI